MCRPSIPRNGAASKHLLIHSLWEPRDPTRWSSLRQTSMRRHLARRAGSAPVRDAGRSVVGRIAVSTRDEAAAHGVLAVRTTRDTTGYVVAQGMSADGHDLGDLRDTLTQQFCRAQIRRGWCDVVGLVDVRLARHAECVAIALRMSSLVVDRLLP
jgi:hypothetical protein